MLTQKIRIIFLFRSIDLCDNQGLGFVNKSQRIHMWYIQRNKGKRMFWAITWLIDIADRLFRTNVVDASYSVEFEVGIRDERVHGEPRSGLRST